jgi:hypothetical protein
LATTTEGAWTAARDGRDDGDLGGIVDGGAFLFGEIADVFVVEVEVDEGAELAFGGVEVLAHGREALDEGGESFADGGAGDGDGLLPLGEGAKRGWDVNLHGSIMTRDLGVTIRPGCDEV